MREAYILRNFRETAQKRVPTVRIVEDGVGVVIHKCDMYFETHPDPSINLPPVRAIVVIYPDDNTETFGVDRIHIVDALPPIEEVKIRVVYAEVPYTGVLRRVEEEHENLSS